MTGAVARTIIRLWKLTKSSKNAIKVYNMKKLKTMAAPYGGVSKAVGKANKVRIGKAADRLGTSEVDKSTAATKMILRNDPAKKRR